MEKIRLNYTLNEENVITSYSIIPFDPTLPFIEVDEGTVIIAGIDKIENGELVVNTEARNRQIEISNMKVEIAELKKALADSDYLAIKFAEGELTEEEYAPHKEQRKQYRLRINELEEALKN